MSITVEEIVRTIYDEGVLDELLCQAEFYRTLYFREIGKFETDEEYKETTEKYGKWLRFSDLLEKQKKSL